MVRGVGGKHCDCDVSEKVKSLVESGTYAKLQDVVTGYSEMENRIETLEKMSTQISDAILELKKSNSILEGIICGVGKSKGIDEIVRELDEFFRKLKPIVYIISAILGFIGVAGIWKSLQFIVGK